MLTNRDREIIDILDKFKCAKTSHIKRLCFKNVTLTRCQDRLKKLYEQGHLKRFRSHIDLDYVYYLDKKPQQIEHMLHRLEFYSTLQESHKIYRCETEFICGDIRADAYIEAANNRYVYGFLVEVHLSNKFDQEKYEKLYRTPVKTQNNWSNFPRVVIITSKKIFLKPSNIVFKVVDLNMKNIETIFE